MADFQTSVLDPIAQVIGGSQPDTANRPRWFSGKDVGDKTGLIVPLTTPAYPDFKGCYSAPPDMIQDYPIGILLPGPFKIEGGDKANVFTFGSEMNIDDLRLLILLSRVDLETTFSNMTPYRDLVPTALATHMTAFGNVLQAMVVNGKPVSITWGKAEFDAIEFTVRVLRMVNRAYVA